MAKHIECPHCGTTLQTIERPDVPALFFSMAELGKHLGLSRSKVLDLIEGGVWPYVELRPRAQGQRFLRILWDDVHPSAKVTGVAAIRAVISPEQLGETVSVHTVAKLLGVEVSSVRRLRNEGVIPRRGVDQYPVTELADALCARYVGATQ